MLQLTESLLHISTVEGKAKVAVDELADLQRQGADSAKSGEGTLKQ